MRKHWQVLLADYQALPAMHSGHNVLVQQWSFRFDYVEVPADLSGIPRPEDAAASCPAPWAVSNPEKPAREAKLRLLAPALRRALWEAACHSRQHQTKTQRELLLEQLDSALAQSQALAEYLFICLSPANALPLRIDWKVA